MPSLTLQIAGKQQQLVLGQNGAVIGRGPQGVSIRLNDPAVSERHCRVGRTKSGGWAVQDLGSASGTFLNGQKLATAKALKPGDQIKVGAVLLVFRDGAAASAPAAAAKPTAPAVMPPAPAAPPKTAAGPAPKPVAKPAPPPEPEEATKPVSTMGDESASAAPEESAGSAPPAEEPATGAAAPEEAAPAEKRSGALRGRTGLKPGGIKPGAKPGVKLGGLKPGAPGKRPVAAAGPAAPPKKGGALKLVIAAVVLIVLGGGGWFAYTTFVAKDDKKGGAGEDGKPKEEAKQEEKKEEPKQTEAEQAYILLEYRAAQTRDPAGLIAEIDKQIAKFPDAPEKEKFEKLKETVKARAVETAAAGWKRAQTDAENALKDKDYGKAIAFLRNYKDQPTAGDDAKKEADDRIAAIGADAQKEFESIRDAADKLLADNKTEDARRLYSEAIPRFHDLPALTELQAKLNALPAPPPPPPGSRRLILTGSGKEGGGSEPKPPDPSAPPPPAAPAPAPVPDAPAPAPAPAPEEKKEEPKAQSRAPDLPVPAGSGFEPGRVVMAQAPAGSASEPPPPKPAPPAKPHPAKVNMLSNGDFEGGEDPKFRGAGKGWESNDNQPHPGHHALDGTVKHGGKFSQRIDTKGGDKDRKDGTWDQWPLRQVTPYSSIQAGKKYRVTAWVKAQGNGNPNAWYTIGVWWFNADTYLKDTKQPEPPKPRNNDYDWKLIEFDAEAPPGATRAAVFLSAHYHGVVWYDDIVFGLVE